MESTPLERWLATHSAFFAARWRERFRQERVRETNVTLDFARLEVGAQADLYVSSLGTPKEDERLGKLIAAVVAERNALLDYVFWASGEKARDVVSRTMGKSPDEPAPKQES